MRLFRKIEDGVELRLDHGTLVTAVVVLGVCASLIFLMGLLVGRMIWAGQGKAEQVRAAHPWAERVNRTGWALLITSLVLRLLGAA